MNFDVFIPVRLNNTRYPGKALKEIDGKPILLYLIKRLRQSLEVRYIVVCTTTEKIDDKLSELLDHEKIKYFRGSEKDILKRFSDAATMYDTDIIINVDGDDIYTDPYLIDELILEFKKTNADYIDMIDYPFGFRIVGFTKSALQKVCELKDTSNTETGYRDYFYKIDSLQKHILKFDKVIEIPSNLRLSLDYQEDFELAKELFHRLGNSFHLSDILLEFKKHPDLLNYTNKLQKKWKQHYEKNLTDFSVKN